MQLKIQIVMKLKNSNCEETQIVMNLNNSYCDETKNSSSDETQKLKL